MSVTDPFDTVREALYAATRGPDLSLAPVPGTPVGDAHLALASIEERLKEAERLGSQWLCDCHTWPDADEAHAYIVAIEERLRKQQDEMRVMHNRLFEERDRTRAAEQERDEWKEKWKRTHERLGIALGVDDPLSEEDVDKLAGAAVAGLRRGQMRVAPQEPK